MKETHPPRPRTLLSNFPWLGLLDNSSLHSQICSAARPALLSRGKEEAGDPTGQGGGDLSIREEEQAKQMPSSFKQVASPL